MAVRAADDFAEIARLRKEMARAEAPRCPSDPSKPVADCINSLYQPCAATCPRHGLWVNPALLDQKD